MSALAFLAKKSWHVMNINNQEAVWLAEQKVLKEKARLAEFEKELVKERKELEFRKLQAAAGLAPKDQKERLDWMYKDGGKQKAEQTEDDLDEYLMGKQLVDVEEDKALKAVLSGSSDASSSSKGAVSSKWLNKANDSNESFRRLHEDPMYFISKQQKEQSDKALRNPLLARRKRMAAASHHRLLSGPAAGRQPMECNVLKRKKSKKEKKKMPKKKKKKTKKKKKKKEKMKTKKAKREKDKKEKKKKKRTRQKKKKLRKRKKDSSGDDSSSSSSSSDSSSSSGSSSGSSDDSDSDSSSEEDVRASKRRKRAQSVTNNASKIEHSNMQVQLGPSAAYSSAAQKRLDELNPVVASCQEALSTSLGGGAPAQSAAMSREEKIAMMRNDAAAHASHMERLMKKKEASVGEDNEITQRDPSVQPDFVRQVQKDFYMGEGAPKSLSESLKMTGKK